MADLIPEKRFVPFVHVWTHGLPLSARQTWVTSRFHIHLLAAAAGARGIAVGMKKGYYDVKHESRDGAGQRLAARPGQRRPAMPAQRGSLAEDLPALVARKRAEAGELYPALQGQTGSLTAGAAKLFNKALAAPLRNKTRPGAR